MKLVISDPSTRKSKTIEITDKDALRILIGRKIGDVIDGSFINLPGYKLQITGGRDKDGFPMRPDVHGGVRKKVLLAGGVGFRPKKKGERRRKFVRGNVITPDIVNVNMKIVEKPSKV